MTREPSYEELKQRVKELEQQAVEREGRERTWRESRELFEKTFEIQKDAILILSADVPPEITACNSAAEKVFGYTRQEMLGRTTEFLHVNEPALREFQRRLYSEISEQGFIHLNDFTMKRKNGSIFPTEHRVAPLNNERGERTGWVFVIRDISERRQMEEEMRESRERYRLLAENVSDVIFTRDMDLRFTYISPSVEKLTGYSVEEAMALTMAESYTPRTIELTMEAFSEELSMEREGRSDSSRVRTLEMEGYRKDGSTIWTEAKTTFLRDSHGHPVGILGVSRDITLRKQAERAMIISEERYRSLVEDMPVLVCRFLPDGTLTFVNNSYCDYFGRKREKLIGENFFQFIPEEERREVKDRFVSLTRENPVVAYEHQVIRFDGTRRWQHRIDRALFDESGDLKEYQCLGLDVTDRRQAEEALREKEAIFSAFLEHSPIFVFFKDKDVRSIHLSRNYEQMLGMPLDRALGKTMDELFPSDLAKSMIADDLRVLREGERVDVEEELDGRIYETIKFPVLKDGEPFVLAGFTMDITDRKRAEEALRESENRYRQLCNHAPAGIYEVDFLKRTFVTVNDVICKYTGYIEEEFLSMAPEDILSDEGKTLYAERVRRMMAGESVPEAAEYKIITKNGKELWVAVNTNPVYEYGKIKGATAVVHDITERRKVARVLKQSEERLRSLSAELIKVQEEERRRISREIHDELGQLLAILKHRVRSIEKSLHSELPEIEADVESAVGLIEEVIDKVRQIARDLNPSLLDDLGLRPALRYLTENLMEECEIPVFLYIGNVDALISKETARNVYRICQEALTNILKHAEATQTQIKMSEEGDYLSLFIEDDGKGFDLQAIRERDPAQRGLGLVVIQERANLIGGKVEIESHPDGGGTKIVLTIPVEKRGTQSWNLTA